MGQQRVSRKVPADQLDRCDWAGCTDLGTRETADPVNGRPYRLCHAHLIEHGVMNASGDLPGQVPIDSSNPWPARAQHATTAGVREHRRRGQRLCGDCTTFYSRWRAENDRPRPSRAKRRTDTASVS